MKTLCLVTMLFLCCLMPLSGCGSAGEQLVGAADYQRPKVKAPKEYVYSLKEIQLPYINIDSEDARAVNQEIETLHEALMARFVENVENGQAYTIANYKYSQKKTLLSVVIYEENGGGEGHNETVGLTRCYNFDLNTGAQIKGTALFDYFDMEATHVEQVYQEYVKTYVEWYEQSTQAISDSGGSVSAIVVDALAHYRTLFEADQLPCYMNEDMELCVKVGTLDDPGVIIKPNVVDSLRANAPEECLLLLAKAPVDLGDAKVLDHYVGQDPNSDMFVFPLALDTEVSLKSVEQTTMSPGETIQKYPIAHPGDALRLETHRSEGTPTQVLVATANGLRSEYFMFHYGAGSRNDFEYVSAFVF